MNGLQKMYYIGFNNSANTQQKDFPQYWKKKLLFLKDLQAKSDNELTNSLSSFSSIIYVFGSNFVFQLWQKYIHVLSSK